MIKQYFLNKTILKKTIQNEIKRIHKNMPSIAKQGLDLKERNNHSKDSGSHK